jgi:hypothetical protein
MTLPPKIQRLVQLEIKRLAHEREVDTFIASGVWNDDVAARLNADDPALYDEFLALYRDDEVMKWILLEGGAAILHEVSTAENCPSPVVCEWLAARHIGWRPGKLRTWRKRRQRGEVALGTVPPWIQTGRRVAYRVADLDAWRKLHHLAENWPVNEPSNWTDDESA